MDRQEQEPGPRASEDNRLKRVITALHACLRGDPGVRRIHAWVRVLGHRIGRKRVWRLMRELGLQGRHRQTVEDHHHTGG